MKIKRRFIVLLCMVCFCLLVGCATKPNQTEGKEVSYDEMMTNWKTKSHAKEMICWYTDKNDGKWLAAKAKAFEKKYNISVQPVYYDGYSLFEDMNKASQNGTGPDVYICSNDQLQLARDSGFALENEVYSDKFWEDNYPAVAKNAVTYKNKCYGYPVYFDTYCLVYDSKLLETAPASMDDILAFADEYSDTGSTKAIMRWDVADPYINTMFLAPYANIFGENGDDSTQFDIHNDKTVESMTYFQSLSEYLWMDKSNISHDIVKNRIKDKTLVLGLCKSDVLPILYELQDDEEVSYTLSYVPSLTSELSTSVISTTYIAMVNPYGEDNDLGNMFASFLSYSDTEKQYELNSKLSVVDQKDKFDQFQSIIYAQYVNSTPVSKVILTGDYMAEGAIAYDSIWKGEDVDEQLNDLQKTITEKMKN